MRFRLSVGLTPGRLLVGWRDGPVGVGGDVGLGGIRDDGGKVTRE
jgi:hypothetical protein